MAERYTAELTAWLAGRPAGCAGREQCPRASRGARSCRRIDERLLEQGRAVLAGVDLVPVDDDILRVAAGMPDPGLRSLAALHLASAMSFHPDLDALVAYDSWLLAASGTAGLAVAQPGV